MKHQHPTRALGTHALRFFNLCTLSVLALALSLGVASTAFAQSASTGTIKGKAINASNGTYLRNVAVGIAGTNRQVLTNDFGDYELTNVPAGQVTLTADYIGEPTQTLTASVPSGGVANLDITFRETAGTRTRDDGTIVLDQFTVSAERYQNAQAIAIAEQRTSVNIKNVVAVDAFGDIPSGNVGEFVKFLPGIQVDYGAFNGNNQGFADSDATGVSVRGFGPEDTAILIDGMPVASATPGNLSRQVALDQLSINNASRVELIKVATPDLPANSMGGQVNLITKSAFEQARPSYSGRVFFNVNTLNASLKKTVGPVNKSTYKTQPGVDFTISYPFSNTMGMSFTGAATNEINQSYRAQTDWTNSGNFSNFSGVPISLENPALTRLRTTDTARITKRQSGNLRFDWRPTGNQLVRANVQYSTYNGVEGSRRLDFRPTMGAGSDWGPDYTIGRDANSTIAQTVFTRDREGDTKSAQIQYSLDLRGWKIAAAGSISVSESEFRDEANGHYSEVEFNLNPGQVAMYEFANGIPSRVEAVWRSNAGALAGTPKDYTDFSNWGFSGTTAKSGQGLNKDEKRLLKLDIERDLSFLPFLGDNALSLKVGVRRDQDKIDKSGRGTGYAEILRPDASYAVADVFDTHYVGQSPGFGLPAQQWGSTYKLFELNQQNDLFFAPEDGGPAISNYNSFANQQKSMTETRDGYYAMLSGRFFNNRLSIVGGGRKENRLVEGLGPFTDNSWNFAKTPDGHLYRDDIYRDGVRLNGGNQPVYDADGNASTISNFNHMNDAALLARMTAAGVNFPDHVLGPTNASLESRQLQLVANRYIRQRRDGRPSFSLNTAYKLTDKIDLKAAVSRSFKMPTLEDGRNGLLSGSNQFTIVENTVLPADGTVGTINVANPGLLPEEALGLDFEVAYYTDAGGRFAVSYWHKTVTNQVESTSVFSNDPFFAEVLPALGLDPAVYDDWRLTTSYNSATEQKTDGWEFEVRQDFRFLGGWGRHFSAFASYSFKSLGDPVAPVPFTITAPNGQEITVTPTVSTITRRANRFGGAGLQFSTRRLTAQVRGVYRNDNEVQRITLTGAYEGNFLRRYQPAATNIDFNLNYMISERYNVFVSGRDIFKGSRKEVWRDDQGLFPSYAELHDLRKFGTVWTVGVNGKW